MSKLKQFVQQVRGISYKPEEITDHTLPDYLPILKANNITAEGLDEEDLIFIHRDKIRPEQFIRKGDLLIAASSGSKSVVGKHIFFNNDYEGSFGAFCKVVRPVGRIYPEFLSHFFKTPFYKNHIQRVIQGANINNLRNEHIDDLEIPDFEIEEQIRISTVLSKAEALIAQRKESIRLLDEFLKSTFLDMFGDPIQNNKEWKTLRLGSTIKIKHGFAFKSDYFSDNGEFVLLTPGNFNEEGGFRDRGERQKFYTGEIPQEYILNKDDLLLAMTEQAPGLLGSPLLVPDSGRFLHNQRLGLVTFSREDFNERFLYHLFNTKGIRTRIHAKATGTKVRHTSPGKIEELIIYQPPIGLQNRFGDIALKTERMNSQLGDSLRELEILLLSLNQVAFNKGLDLSLLQIDVAAYISVTSETESPKVTQRKPNRETFESKQVEAVAMQAVANKIIENYKGFHFSFEMLHSFIEQERLSYTDYFSSEEMKKNPKLNINPDDVEDLKNFVTSAIVNRTTDEQMPKNPWIKLNQIFYDASKPNASLNLKLEDLEKTSNRSIEDQSGIFFEIVS